MTAKNTYKATGDALIGALTRMQESIAAASPARRDLRAVKPTNTACHMFTGRYRHELETLDAVQLQKIADDVERKLNRVRAKAASFHCASYDPSAHMTLCHLHGWLTDRLGDA